MNLHACGTALFNVPHMPFITIAIKQSVCDKAASCAMGAEIRKQMVEPVSVTHNAQLHIIVVIIGTIIAGLHSCYYACSQAVDRKHASVQAKCNRTEDNRNVSSCFCLCDMLLTCYGCFTISACSPVADDDRSCAGPQERSPAAAHAPRQSAQWH